ncbi:unnamed protein product [Polarella glacialis]|uniref:Uncharacterized protein n=1 Tax=Polarella glacialis TaxID=89957 RepID=A0A813KFI7_POLGL|nr:unnamed protein product [Polarella glacialis]
MANNSEIYLQLVELSGHIVAEGTWSATLPANCLYQCAHLAKPGHQCRLLQGSWEISPITPLAALDLRFGICIQVVWLSSSAFYIGSQRHAFAAMKVDGSVVTWGGRAYRGGAGCGGDSSVVAQLLMEGVVKVCGSSRAFAAIKADGSVVTWGMAACGGDSSLVAPLLTEGVVHVCGNSKAFAAIKADGSVVTWGNAICGGDS